MSLILQSICFTVDPEITLPNTAPSPPVRLKKGNYVAFPEKGAQPGAYKLHEADDQWKAKETVIATVGIEIDRNGKARIS
jgi:hypothetical protein